ncbi:MAG: 3-isopropylmalate dehydratase [Clostridiaceae bacterium]|nr:3-isopropylmalate dehydratase [Clostridiaceae bacterium]
MNRIEKWLAQAAGVKTTKPGDDLSCQVAYVGAHDVTSPIAIDQFEAIGVDRVFDPDRVFMVVDHIYPASTEKARQGVWKMKDFAERYGTHLFEKGEGVIHQVLHEKFDVQPGDIVVIADSHTCTCGGYGAIGIGVGSTEQAAAMATGKLDVEVPEVVNVVLTGKLSPYVSGKDLILFLAAEFGADYLTDRGLIISGPGINEFSIAERMTVCNMGTELGSMITLFGDEEPETDVMRTLEVDLSDLKPQIACPFSPVNVKPVSEVAGTPITQVAVGSCTNGRLNDMEQVYNVLKDHKVASHVNMLVFPASREIQNEMDRLGWSEVIRNAGATLLNPGCGPCFGAHEGLVTPRDVVVSSTNRNFPGRMGSTEAQIYLASPLTAVLSAVKGEIVEPGAENA